jgi:hypothetical protein
MIINTTNKTADNDYLNNTENVAMVHVCRVFDATDVTENSGADLELEIENLNLIIDVIAQCTNSINGNHVEIQDIITWSGNVITFEEDSEWIVDGHILNLLVIGK